MKTTFSGPLSILGMAALLLSLQGCITVERTSTGDFGYEERLEKAISEILELSKQSEAEVLAAHEQSTDSETRAVAQRHFARADEIVLQHTSSVRRQIPFVTFNDYLDKRRTLLDYTLKLEPHLSLIESELAFAMAFPSGRVLISDTLVRATGADSNSDNSILQGILIHELLHVRDGHAIEQWATADGRKEWLASKSIGALANIASLIPILSVRYDVNYGTAFKSARQLSELSEYAADLGTVQLLDAHGFAGQNYIAFLDRVNAATGGAANTSGEPFSWLEGRTGCLQLLSATRFSDEVSIIVIGTEDEGTIQTLDMHKAHVIAGKLDNPAEMRELYGDAASLSNEELGKAVLSSVQNIMFIACAIRNVFPEARPVDGLLQTPGFDLAMFTQYL